MVVLIPRNIQDPNPQSVPDGPRAAELSILSAIEFPQSWNICISISVKSVTQSLVLSPQAEAMACHSHGLPQRGLAAISSGSASTSKSDRDRRRNQHSPALILNDTHSASPLEARYCASDRVRSINTLAAAVNPSNAWLRCSTPSAFVRRVDMSPLEKIQVFPPGFASRTNNFPDPASRMMSRP